jgi:hypothetical protein
LDGPWFWKDSAVRRSKQREFKKTWSDLMEKYLFSIGIIAAVLLAVRQLLKSSAADDVLAELARRKDEKSRIDYEKEVARLTEEIKDAKLDYQRIRDAKPVQPTDPGSEL